MTATDILRRLLDERGVRHYDTPNGTCWGYLEMPLHGRMYTHYAVEVDDLLCVDSHCLTPEQAIDATLGRGTCRDLSGTGANGEQVFKCSECGCVLSLYDRDGSNNLCTSFIFDYPRYCPECGRRVVE